MALLPNRALRDPVPSVTLVVIAIVILHSALSFLPAAEPFDAFGLSLWRVMETACLLAMGTLLVLIVRRARRQHKETQAAARELAERLREDRDLLKSVLDSLDEGVVLVKRVGDCRALNPMGAEFLDGANLRLSPDEALNVARMLSGERIGLDDDPEESSPDPAPPRPWAERATNGSRRLHIHLMAQDAERDPAPTNRDDDPSDPACEGTGDEEEDDLRRRLNLESVGAMAGRIAHDLGNVFTVVSGRTSLTLAGLDKENRCYSDLQDAARAAKRGIGLVQQLLDLTRDTREPSERLDLNESIVDLQHVLRHVLREDQDLVLELDSEPCIVRFGRSQLEHVLLNLALNARDAMPRGGTLGIKTRTRTIAFGDADTLAPGPYGVFEVSDTGTGMTAEVCSRIFEPFFTTRKTGAGLGLATALEFVRQAGGTILVHTELGAGARFSVHLPAVTP